MNKFLVLMTTMLLACSQKEKISNNEAAIKTDSSKKSDITIDNDFREIVELLPVMKTPITFDSDLGVGYEPFNIEDEKSLLKIRKGIPEYLGYAKVEETKNYYLIIGISSSDIGSPVLMTFDKAGRKIDSFFMFKTAGGDIEYYSKNIVTLENNTEFVLTDSTTTRELNETGDEDIEGTEKLTSRRTMYKILDTGKIVEISE